MAMKRHILCGLVLIFILSFSDTPKDPPAAAVRSLAMIPKQDPAGDALKRGRDFANMLEALQEGRFRADGP